MKRLGKLKPRFKFFLNPYPDVRFTRCPKCQGKTKLRKLPLLIHVDPENLMVLNKTCRFCPYCELLIAHQDEIEAQLTGYFGQHNPEVVGNEYLVLGTVDRPAWQQGTQAPVGLKDMLEQAHDFKKILEFELTGGWMPNDETDQVTAPVD